MNLGMDFREVTETIVQHSFQFLPAQLTSVLLSHRQNGPAQAEMAGNARERSKQRESKGEALSPGWLKQHLLLYSP